MRQYGPVDRDGSNNPNWKGGISNVRDADELLEMGAAVL